MEQLSESGAIDLYYGDEAGVALEPNVPYGWQFADEEVSMPSERGAGINCFGLFTRVKQKLDGSQRKDDRCRFCRGTTGEVFVFALEIDRRRVGQCADSHRQKDA